MRINCPSCRKTITSDKFPNMYHQHGLNQWGSADNKSNACKFRFQALCCKPIKSVENKSLGEVLEFMYTDDTIYRLKRLTDLCRRIITLKQSKIKILKKVETEKDLSSINQKEASDLAELLSEFRNKKEKESLLNEFTDLIKENQSSHEIPNHSTLEGMKEQLIEDASQAITKLNNEISRLTYSDDKYTNENLPLGEYPLYLDCSDQYGMFLHYWNHHRERIMPPEDSSLSSEKRANGSSEIEDYHKLYQSFALFKSKFEGIVWDLNYERKDEFERNYRMAKLYLKTYSDKPDSKDLQSLITAIEAGAKDKISITDQQFSQLSHWCDSTSREISDANNIDTSLVEERLEKMEQNFCKHSFVSQHLLLAAYRQGDWQNDRGTWRAVGAEERLTKKINEYKAKANEIANAKIRKRQGQFTANDTPQKVARFAQGDELTK